MPKKKKTFDGPLVGLFSGGEFFDLPAISKVEFDPGIDQDF